MNGTCFAQGVQVKTVLGYGIAMFDCDLDYDTDNIDFCDIWDRLWDITETSNFQEFASSRGVSISEWKGEDCKQMWIVYNPIYETTGFAPLGQISEDVEARTAVETVRDELFRRLKESSAWSASYDAVPEWTLGLYYD